MLWKLGNAADLSPGFAEIMVASNRRVTPKAGREAYRTSSWDARAETAISGIPVTGINRTLVDLAAFRPLPLFHTVLNAALRQRLTTKTVFLRAAQREALIRRPGAGNIRTAIGSVDPNAVALSEWSIWVADLCEANGLPRPKLESRIYAADGTLVAQVDLCWPEYRLVVELDSVEFHLNRPAFERDRERTTKLSIDRFVVLPFTWNQYKETPDFLVTSIRTALRNGGWQG